jgi:hypothetical protein
MLTPFGGPDNVKPAHDTYDLYISQLRIEIELTLGRMTKNV